MPLANTHQSDLKPHYDAMSDASHRILSRPKAAAIALAALVFATLIAVWLSDWVQHYSDTLSALIDADLKTATATIQMTMFWVAAIHLGVIGVLVAYLLRTAIAGIKHQMMPPPGRWIVEGRAIRKGAEAVRAAKIIIALALIISLLGAGISIIIFHLADTLSLTA